jgi:hypothetical protein
MCRSKRYKSIMLISSDCRNVSPTLTFRGSVPASSARGNARSQNSIESGQSFIRSVSIQDRTRLTQGKLIEVWDYRGTKIGEIPLAPFNAASTQKDRVIDDKITFPQEYDVEQVQRSLSKMLIIAKSTSNVELAPSNVVGVDLHLHSVAKWLGMDSFTQKIFDAYFKSVNKMIPTQATIEAIQLVHTPPGDKIFKQMAYNFATQYFEDKMGNREAFESYLETNERLKEAVMDVVYRKEMAVKVKAQKEASDLAFHARERRRQEKGKYDVKETKLYEARQIEKSSELAKREERLKKEADVCKSMLEKKRMVLKLDPDKARAHETLFGKAVAA